MLTPEGVIAELERLGYAMTARRLVDWRQKGLLPSLSKRGRGHGKGWVFVWEDPEVIEQTVAILDLLQWRARTDWLPFALWCLGFPMPLDQVKPRLLTRLDANLAQLRADAKNAEDMADHLSRLAIEQVAIGTRRGSNELTLPPEVIEFWLSMLARSTAYTPDYELFKRVSDVIAASYPGSVLGSKPGRETSSKTFSPAMLRRAQRWVIEYASLPVLRAAVLDSGDDLWDRVRRDRRVVPHIVWIVTKDMEPDAGREVRSLWYRMTAGMGPFVAVGDLGMRYGGLGSLIDRIVGQASEWADRLEHDPEIRASLQDFALQSGVVPKQTPEQSADQGEHS